jgi:tetratricopeptide (TPR) repeat protein
MRKKYYLFIILVFVLSSCTAAKKIVVKSPTIPRISESTQRQFDYYFYEGLKQKDNQQYDQAIETFRMCLAIDSLDAGAQSETGLLYAAAGMNDKALDCLEKAVKIDPSNWWYNVQLISMYSDLKNWKRAIELTVNLQKK